MACPDCATAPCPEPAIRPVAYALEDPVDVGRDAGQVGTQPLLLMLTIKVRIPGGGEERKELLIFSKPAQVAGSPVYATVRFMRAPSRGSPADFSLWELPYGFCETARR